MEAWNHIVHAALLGTEKKPIKKEELIPEVAEYFESVAEQTPNREEAFLNTASILYNIRQCGFIPAHKEGLIILKADEEEKKYASELAHRVLYDILETSSNSLFHFWLI